MKFPKDTYLKQINDYYNRSLSSHVLINLGTTPQYLVDYGVPELPLVIKQSTLTKCIRKSSGSRSAHDLPRSIIETLPEQIENPIFLIKEKERNSVALISDAEDKAGDKLLTAIQMNTELKSVRVNEIKSVYGKTNLKEFLQKHIAKKQLYIINNKKAEILSRVIGLQLPKALINFSYKKRISSENEKVNKNFQFLGKKKMIALMKSQFEHSADVSVRESDFRYTKFDSGSERLEYNDAYGDRHDLYHSMIAGEEMCLYHVNEGRNRRIKIPDSIATQGKDSVVAKLNTFNWELRGDKETLQISKDNNLEHQQPHQER